MNGTAGILRPVDAVVFGTSAGGVDALGRLLPALDDASAVAACVVIHLPRERPSLMVDIFSRRCRRPVREAVDKAPIEPGVTYFAPPDYHLLVDDGPTLALSVDPPVHHSRPSIDVLFESAAQVYQTRLLAVLLTGASADGSQGLAAVRRAGGLVAIQDPDDAEAPAMVRAGLERVVPDFLLPLDAMAELLASLVRRPHP